MRSKLLLFRGAEETTATFMRHTSGENESKMMSNCLTALPAEKIGLGGRHWSFKISMPTTTDKNNLRSCFRYLDFDPNRETYSFKR